MLHARDHQHAGLLERPLQRQPGALDHAARERLHGDDADVLLHGLADDLLPRVGLEEAEADHQRVEQLLLDGAGEHVETVAGDADVPDQTLVLSFAVRLERAPGRSDGAIVGVACHEVALVDVDVVPVEFFQARFQIGAGLVGRLRVRLRGEHHPVGRCAHLLEGQPDAALAGGVRARGVDEVDAPLDGVADRSDRLLLRHPLDGYAAEPQAVHVEACPTQHHSFHESATTFAGLA